MKQKEMFAMVESWHNSNLTKQQFAKEHNLSYHKLNYWIRKYNKSDQAKESHQDLSFHEVHLPKPEETAFKKVLELTTQSGTHIVIYG